MRRSYILLVAMALSPTLPFIKHIAVSSIARCAETDDWDTRVAQLISKANGLERRYPTAALETLTEAQAIAARHLEPRDWRTLDVKCRISRIVRRSQLTPHDLQSLEKAYNECHRAMRLFMQQGPLEAAVVQRRALKEIERLEGSDVPDYAHELGNLASFEDACGNVEAAFEFRLVVARIVPQQLGLEHPTTGAAIGNLGSAVAGFGHPAIARCLVKRALEIMDLHDTVGADRASARAILAQCEMQIGNPELALDHFDQALQDNDSEPEVLSRRWAAARVNALRADVLAALNRPADAILDAERALAFFADALPNDPGQLHARAIMACCRAVAGETEVARRSLDDIQEQLRANDEPIEPSLHQYLASAYEAIGDDAEAITEWRRIISALKSAASTNHLALARSYSHIARLARTTDPGEADVFMKRADIEREANAENEIVVMRQLESVGIEFSDVERKAMSDAAETLYTLPADRGSHAMQKDATRTNEDARRTKASPARK